MGIIFCESDFSEIHAYFDRFNEFGIDLETTGLNPHDSSILLCQIGFPDDTQFVIDARATSLEPLLPYLNSHRWQKLFYNGKFEGTFFYHFYDTPINNVYDGQLGERISNMLALGEASLEDVVLKYCDVQLDKETRKSFFGGQIGPFTEQQINYAANDVKYLFEVRDKQLEQIRQQGQEHILNLENDLVTVIALMEVTGVPVDSEKWLGILQEYVEEHQKSKERLLALLDADRVEDAKELNLNSPKQLKEAFAKVGVPLTATNNQIIALIKHPAAEELVTYRGLQKLISSYGQDSFISKIHPFTGRIHPSWQQIGAETGRFSCRVPNMQQIPEKLRKAVGGDPNYVLLGADFSQMELRILAQQSKDPILVRAFTSGKDIHTATASAMFNIKEENVTKEQRYIGKTLNFGITYGMQAKKFMDMMNIENKKEDKPLLNIQQAAKLVDMYKRTYFTASKYLEYLGTNAITKHYAETRYGRKRPFNIPDSKLPPRMYSAQIAAIKRAGANMVIQGGNADITKMAMINIHNELRDYGYRANIILQVHDEIVLLAHKSQAESIKSIVQDSMVNAGKILLPDIPVVVEPYISEYWPK